MKPIRKYFSIKITFNVTKINPISNKLGISRIWNHKFQKYGRSLKNYVKFLRFNNYVTAYLKRFMFKNNLIVKNTEITSSNSQISIKIFLFSLNYTPDKKIKLHILNTASYWTSFPVKVTLFRQNNLSDSSFLIANYISYLFSRKLNTPKLILQLIYSTLKSQSYKKNIIYTNRGLQTIYLRGFKLEFNGCFESSRSQMSKTLKCNFGSNSLSRLRGYVDYSTGILFTKFGSCGFKIWLFYELV